MESTAGEDAMKIVEITTMNVENYKNLTWLNSYRVWEDWFQVWKKFSCGLSTIEQHHKLQRKHSWKEKSINVADFIVVLF